MSKIFTVKMPDIGEGVVEGEVIAWLKQVNDPLEQDEPVVIVMTDKATVELPAPYAGKLAKQYYQVGQTALLDHPLYDIELTINIDIPEQKEILSSTLPEPSKDMHTDTVKVSVSHGKALAAPPTRLLARQLGVDLTSVPASGEQGIVTKEDVIKYHTGKKREATPLTILPGDQEVPLVGIRQLMAKRMVESKTNIPHFSYFEHLDASRLVQLRQSFKEEAAKQGITVTYMPFIIKALSISLKKYPLINSSVDMDNGKIIVHQEHNVGIAMTTKNGLIVPVLKAVQKMSLQEVIMAYDALKVKATAGKLQPSDMKESTISISNFGVLGGEGQWATPIINYPESAILAIARIHKQPFARNGVVVVRDVLNLSWSFDHRVIDGDLAANFSHYFSTLLQNPAPLL